MKGPALFLVQFLGPRAPSDSLPELAAWAASLGYEAVQLPTFRPDLFDLERAAASLTYCDEVKGVLGEHGLVLSELSTHRQGHCVATNPAYGPMLDHFGPAALAGDATARQRWAREQLMLAAKASGKLGLASHVTFSGHLLWPFLYPYPPLPAGLVDDAFTELARIWRPIMDAFDDAGCDVCFELHPGEDLHDGHTFELLLDKLGGHRRCNILYDPSHLLLQHIDYLGFIERYHERIRAFHVKDAEFVRSDRSGVYGGYQTWGERPGRFRSLGDGQVDFGSVFSRLAYHGYDRWAVVEWECYLKHPEDGAREAVDFVRRHMIRRTAAPFDDFMRAGGDPARNRRVLGLD
ncbi:MAG: sugar phosphate isomerase/epimerase family protein [Lautropia sp.]